MVSSSNQIKKQKPEKKKYGNFADWLKTLKLHVTS